MTPSRSVVVDVDDDDDDDNMCWWSSTGDFVSIVFCGSFSTKGQRRC